MTTETKHATQTLSSTSGYTKIVEDDFNRVRNDYLKSMETKEQRDAQYQKRMIEMADPIKRRLEADIQDRQQALEGLRRQLQGTREKDGKTIYEGAADSLIRLRTLEHPQGKELRQIAQWIKEAEEKGNSQEIMKLEAKFKEVLSRSDSVSDPRGKIAIECVPHEEKLLEQLTDMIRKAEKELAQAEQSLKDHVIAEKKK